MRNHYKVSLIWVQRGVKDSISSMESVCNDNYIVDICDTNHLINTTLNGKQFGFSSYNIDHSVNCLDDRFIVWIDVQYWHGNMILDVSIKYNNRRWRIWWRFECNVIKIFYVILDIWWIEMKIKLIWKEIYKPIS